MLDKEFFTEYGEASRYEIQDVVGKGSYGVVASAIDTYSGERVAIKKMKNVFEHVSDATRILREIKLLRLLKHPDIVEIKHIMLPPCRREFKDIYVVFELMETDLHEVIEVNHDLTPGHYQFFLYQLLRALKYIHSANVFHRDLKPKNILANADCKLKICDFGLARASFDNASSAIFWTDYVATRWYRAPELCGSFFSKYTPAVDIWSIGCIFAEMLTGEPLFPGNNAGHQLDLITDLLGTPPVESIAKIRNEKARRYLNNMVTKQSIPFSDKFPHADPMALSLLQRLLAFDPKQRPSAEEALADPYFYGLANLDEETFMKPISKFEFEFERRTLTQDDILEYHPEMLQEYLQGAEMTSFMYPSGLDGFKQKFDDLEENSGEVVRSTLHYRKYASLPSFYNRERVCVAKEEETDRKDSCKDKNTGSVINATLQNSPRSMSVKELEDACRNSLTVQNNCCKSACSGHRLVKSASMSASRQP
ncbi:mitogen-activated protein kinase 17 isoform X2 [Senna tora]|uniref:mitogen-activated protein kinase n=1 Tax=Senna tora TaxID=362788 RepID=A0A834SSD0_9FABA|nr:mitogen-activated protein kinase 17 isoform X2 [Senna tora]